MRRPVLAVIIASLASAIVGFSAPVWADDMNNNDNGTNATQSDNGNGSADSSGGDQATADTPDSDDDY